MTEKDLQLLLTPEIQALIEENLDAAPDRFAMKNPTLPAVATQIRSLQKSRSKLPTFREKRCILPPLALEQCSSERTGEMKFANLFGEVALDLTGGLGVDTAALASRFKRVIYVDSSEFICQVARENFSRLGLRNIEVHCREARPFLETWDGEFDLIYLDPSRRQSAQQNRLNQLEEGVPSPIELRDLLAEKGKRTMVKASPLVVLDLALQQFPPQRVVVNSLEGDCKEVILDTDPSTEERQFVAQFYRPGDGQGTLYTYSRSELDVRKSDLNYSRAGGDVSSPPFYLYQADVAINRLGLERLYFGGEFSHLDGWFTDGPGYYVSHQLDMSFPGRIYSVAESHPFKTKALKKWLKAQKIKKVRVVRRHFDIPIGKIREKLKVKDGGTNFLIFATIADERWCFFGKQEKA